MINIKWTIEDIINSRPMAGNLIHHLNIQEASAYGLEGHPDSVIAINRIIGNKNKKTMKENIERLRKINIEMRETLEFCSSMLIK